MRTREGTIAPLAVYTPAEAPASGMFYKGEMFPEWKNAYFFGALRGEGMMRLEFDETGTRIVRQEKMFDDTYGRIRDVAQGPDGAMYFSTSNTDGRGSANSGDDHIWKISK
jgi:glucose/arabinose dehydrogenase